MHRRLAGADEVAIDEREPLDAILPTFPLEPFERRAFVLVTCHDQLAATDVRHLILGAELIQLTASFHAKPGLERTSRVIEAGVDHAAVVRARVEAGPGMAFEEADRESAPCNRTCGGEPGDASAND